MEENKPPSAKLKQAKLSFCKSTPILITSNSQGQGKKRRNSSSNCLDSPTKSLNKSGKPLNLISLDNTDSINGKAMKIRKISYGQPNGGNDHEVSSSSEAEAGNMKSNSGSFLDRFVRKLPQDVQVEISSTNEMFEEVVQLAADQESASECQINENNVTTEISQSKDVTAKLESIVIEDSEDASVFKASTHNLKTVCEPLSINITKLDHKVHENPIVGVSQGGLESDNKPSNTTVDLETQNGLNIDVDINALDSTCYSGNANSSIVSIDALDDSALDTSFLSAESSTPVKSLHSPAAEDVLDTPLITPSTPATESGKKKRKVDSSKKAEREILKFKKENEKLERKRKLEAEKAEKEQAKKEKREAKEKEKQEQKEKLEREKQEKERAKEEEKRKREEERMKKEEEKRKKQAAIEAKQEEKRKKDEEKRQKEEEKLREEEEKKKKEEKTKQAFQSFFIKPKDTNMKPATLKPSTGMFIPFELKKDMHLAPVVRRDALTEDKKNNLDEILANTESFPSTYLEQLKQREVNPHKTGRILRKNPHPVEDVEVIHDSEALKKVFHCVKLLQFHTDHRPPYYGTWRKLPKLSPRCPWKKDEDVFDYEVDSDEEWEEEEPGESLSCSDGEEEKGEEVEEDDDDGWMVPHGYLSEDEGCNEDDEITPEKLKLQQLAKANAWEEEQKRKLQAAPAIIVGCFFENSPSTRMMGDVRLLYEFKAVMLASSPIQTCLFGSSEPDKSEESISEGGTTTPALNRFKKKAVPDDAMADLIRLVHGNTCGIKRLIREFRVYWLRKISPVETHDVESPQETGRPDDSLTERDLDSSCINELMNDSLNMTGSDEQMSERVSTSSDKKVQEEGYGCSISKRQLELTITKMAVREKRPGFNKVCWYVHENILAQFNMNDIQLPNSWTYLLPLPAKSPLSSASKNAESPLATKNKLATTPMSLGRKFAKSPRVKKQSESSGKKLKLTVHSDAVINMPMDMDVEVQVEDKDIQLKKLANDQRSIKDFALSKEELLKQKEDRPVKIKTEGSSKKTVAGQATPKARGNKPKSQKCIFEFAKTSGNKVLNNLPKTSENISKIENTEVSNVDHWTDDVLMCVANSPVALSPDTTSTVVSDLPKSYFSPAISPQNTPAISSITSDCCTLSNTPTTLQNTNTESIEPTTTGCDRMSTVSESSLCVNRRESEVDCILID